MPLMVENGFKYWVLKTIEKITYSSATQVWPNSFSLLDFIKNHSLTVENKLKLIAKGSSNGIKFSRFDPDILQPEILGLTRNIIRYDPGSIYLLSVGRLVKDKGLIELINVFGRLENKIPNLKLILLGSYENDLDPLPSNILSIIETNKNIVQVSWSDHVEYYMKLANLLVFPSHREGLPAVLMESGAMQLPVICSNIPGNTDVITDNKTGLLFECKSEEQLQEKIEFALTHPEKMKQMAIDLHEEIKLNFTQENIWNSILAQYRLLLSNV
jgi:glycosyltransferase involved in cell wall biosynthesis